MIPNDKVLRFVKSDALETPYLLTDLEQVILAYQHICSALPFAGCYYAVKANPAMDILRSLAEKGANFEAASINEVNACLQAGASPDRILFGNTIKKGEDIRKSYEAGVRTFVFDDASEIEKLATYAPGANVLCRVIDDGVGSVWPLSRKFGCPPDKAIKLLKYSHRQGLNTVGITFHVGSEQCHLKAWEDSLAKAAYIFQELAKDGINLSVLDIGGGFPTTYENMLSPDIVDLGRGIESILKKYFATMPTIIIEPGRFIVANSGTLVGEVVLVSESRGDGKRWVYLDIGKYNGLFDAEAITYPLFTFKDGEKTPVILGGPTADSSDVIESNYLLPKTLTVQDKVLFLHAGAYSFSLSSAEFNGFPALKQHCID